MIDSINHTISARLIDIVLPKGGYAVMLAEAYVDESGSHEGSPILALGGYVYLSEKAKSFSVEWEKVLKEYSLPYFRMSACAHGNDPFDRLDVAARDIVVRKLIKLIHEYSEYGFAVSVNEELYERLIPAVLRDRFGSAYAFCVRQCLTCINNWANSSEFSGYIAYFFESGHASENEADRILNEEYKQNEILVRHFKYVSHTFGDKRVILPLQSADLLAWQFFKNSKNKTISKPSRKDFKALIRSQDEVMECDEKFLGGLKEFLQAKGHFSVDACE